MPLRRRRLSQKEKQVLIEGYLQSPVSLKEYVRDKGVGMSTVGKWAYELGVSLTKKRVASKASVTFKSSSLSQSRPLFVDVTGCVKELQAPVQSSVSMVVQLTGGATLTLSQLSPDQALRYFDPEINTAAQHYV